MACQYCMGNMVGRCQYCGPQGAEAVQHDWDQLQGQLDSYRVAIATRDTALRQALAALELWQQRLEPNAPRMDASQSYRLNSASVLTGNKLEDLVIDTESAIAAIREVVG